MLADGGGSRRKAQHHIPAAAVNGLAEHLYLAPRGIRVIGLKFGVGDIVALDEIDAPRGIKL